MGQFVHHAVTLTAVGTDLKTLLGLLDSEDMPLQSLSIQAAAGNSNAAFIGGSGVTTTSYLVRIPAPVGGVPAAPLIFESGSRPIKLSEVNVVGTAGEILFVGGFVW